VGEVGEKSNVAMVAFLHLGDQIAFHPY
jgi:hypothetical protein